MIAVVEAEAVTAAPELRDWLISLVAFARRAARALSVDRPVTRDVSICREGPCRHASFHFVAD
jgi:hypothetical protein